MKRVLIPVAAALLGVLLVTASHALDGSDVFEMHDPAAMVERGDRGPPPNARPGPPFSHPLMLASRLSAIETFIGIKADQLDSWRGYTDALQALMRPPIPPDDATGAPPDALAAADQLARHASDQGAYALRLAAAVEELRNRLSPDQLQRLRQAGPLLPPPGPPPFAASASCGPPGPEGPGAGHPAPRL